MATLKQFILKKRPQVVVVAAECREVLSVVDDMKMCIAELGRIKFQPSLLRRLMEKWLAFSRPLPDPK